MVKQRKYCATSLRNSDAKYDIGDKIWSDKGIGVVVDIVSFPGGSARNPIYVAHNDLEYSEIFSGSLVFFSYYSYS
jgi:hypothetical protein